MDAVVTEQMSMLNAQYWGTVTNLICFACLIWKQAQNLRKLDHRKTEEFSIL